MRRLRSPVTRSVTSLACAALMLAGCDQHPQTSMNLLRAGDAGICTASDVEDTLRQLIRPKDASGEGYTIAFADASLEAFDKVVSRATCNVALTIDGPNGPVVERTMIDFIVSPSAQDPSSFIVSGGVGPFTDRLQQAMSSDAADKAEQDNERQAQEALTALVKPGWLIGRWVPEQEGSQACANGPYDEYARGGRFNGSSNDGRWRLNGQDATVILPANTVTFTITEASMDAFTMQDSSGTSSFRRCSADESQPPAIEDTEPPSPGEPAPSDQSDQPPPT